VRLGAASSDPVTRIPIDPTAPVACTARSDEIRVRLEQLAHIRDQLRSLERTDGGLLLLFEPDPDLESHLRRFTIDEKGCCRFWGFDVTSRDGGLTLAWEGPPDVQPVLDELERYFRSDEPLTAFSGLL
jgi:hypothetical protein